MTENRDYVLSILSSDAFISVNKKVLRFFNGDATLALVLSELLAMYRYHTQIGSLDELNDAFPVPIKYLEHSLSLSSFKQHRAISLLEKENLLTSFLVGKPASRKLILNFNAIQRILDAPVVDPAKEFYERISEVAEIGDFKLLDQALDNMNDPLRSSVKLITSICIEKKLDLTWTGKGIGLLKLVLRNYDKSELFDYQRLKNLIIFSLEKSPKSIEELILLMIKFYNRINEVSPKERIHTWEGV